MRTSDEDIKRDIEQIGKISIVQTLLDVICQTTGMGFAAVARVTEQRWVTCSVRDDINFGLVPGSELKIETTICNEIRASTQAVVIDNVQEDILFRDHHTPKMYGFRSYISYPIFLKSGEFFGTLCAIDPSPRKLKNTGVMGMFTAFSDLISFHLEQIKLLEFTNETVRELSRQLHDSDDENRQYRHVSSHSLQEPLRKLNVFSGMLVDAVRRKNNDQAEVLALRIQRGADRFSTLIRDLTDFSGLDKDKRSFQATDLNAILEDVVETLEPKITGGKARLTIGELPVLMAVPDQIEQLFFNLLDNAIKFSSKEIEPEIVIHATQYTPSGEHPQLTTGREYIAISVKDNGIGIQHSGLEKIFDVFSQLPSEISQEGRGIGLAMCRKIVRNHSGHINIMSKVGAGTTVTVILPLQSNKN